MKSPSKLQHHRRSNCLSITFDDNTFNLSAEYLRVFSPSAEVRGHNGHDAILQHGKKSTRIVGVENAGSYAIRIAFSDHHDSGIYTWDYLYGLGKNYSANWNQYLQDLTIANKTRDPNIDIIKIGS